MKSVDFPGNQKVEQKLIDESEEKSLQSSVIRLDV